MSAQTHKMDVTNFAFGPLTFSTRGLGVFCMSDKLRERIETMPVGDLRIANREAWRQLRPLIRAANRECNVSIYGWNDRRDHAIDVCEVIKKATWRAIAGVSA